jgi:hypothetical protein
MAKNKHKRTQKTVLKLRDLEQSKSAVMNSLTSASSKRSYDHAIREFIDWLLLRASTRLQQDGGHTISDCPRTAPICSVDVQPEIGGDTPAGSGYRTRGEKGQVLERNKEKGAEGLTSVGTSPGRPPAARSPVTPSYATKCEFERRRASEKRIAIYRRMRRSRVEGDQGFSTRTGIARRVAPLADLRRRDQDCPERRQGSESKNSPDNPRAALQDLLHHQVARTADG